MPNQFPDYPIIRLPDSDEADEAEGAVMFQTARQEAETRRWAVLATHLNGAADSGKYEQITTAVVLLHVEKGDVFEFLARELQTDVDLSKLTDVDRHKLLEHWRIFAKAYDTQQFHVNRSGLALLVAYLLHLILIRHVTPPK
jgi:hypothetical protein